MSLMRTLAKVAVGVALAKGAKSIMDRSARTDTAVTDNRPGRDLGGILGDLVKNKGTASSTGGGGGLQDILGGVLGGRGSGGGTGGLGGLLDSLGGGTRSGGGGGLGGLLGGLAGGLLAGTDDTLRKRPETPKGSFGRVLNSSFEATDEEPIEPSQEQEAQAALLLAAMIQAAKADGSFDQGERDRLLGHLGEVDAQEASFVQRRMQAPVDVDALVAQTPEGMGPQVYAVSLLAIDLDSQEEAQYLHRLAQAYGMDADQVNRIHERLGQPALYK